jgi:hypothetical protein
LEVKGKIGITNNLMTSPRDLLLKLVMMGGEMTQTWYVHMNK